jgi:hypothetical protein
MARSRWVLAAPVRSSAFTLKVTVEYAVDASLLTAFAANGSTAEATWEPSAACHQLLDRRLVLGRGDLLAVRGDEDDPGARAVRRGAGEALLQQVEGALRLDARHREAVVRGGGGLGGGESDGAEDRHPQQGDEPAPPEGHTAQAIKESSHGWGRPPRRRSVGSFESSA